MELVEKFNNKREALNKVEERYTCIDGEYRQSMHVWIMDETGKFLIQKRSPNKKIAPGVWSITGGGVDIGETTLQTVFRECDEELGLKVKEENLELMMTTKTKYSFVDIYLLKQNIDISKLVLQEEEVSDVKLVSKAELYKMIKDNNFAENVALYTDLLMKLIER